MATTAAIHACDLRISRAGVAAAVLVAVGYLAAPVRPSLRFGVAAGIASIAPALLLLAGGGDDSSAYGTASILVFVALVWATVLPFFGAEWPALRRWLGRVGRREVAATIVLLGLGAIYVQHRPHTYIIDETLYVLQSASIFDDLRGIPIDPTLEPFFRIRQTFVHDGYLNGQYPPGWPALLALLRRIGLETFAGPIVYVVSLMCVAALTRALRAGWQTTLLAVVLTGTCFTQLLYADSYFAHGITAVLAMAGAGLVLAAARRSGWRSTVLWTTGALSLSTILTVRPLSALVALAGLAWWMVATRNLNVRSGSAVAVGVAGPAAAQLAYNAHTTGHPLRFGYDLAHGGLQRLGLGLRGEIWLDRSGVPTERIVDFTALDAASKLMDDLGAAFPLFWPGGLMLLLAAFLLARRDPIRLTILVPFLFMPAAYAFYFYPGPRLLVDCLPIVMIATAVLAGRLEAVEPRLTPLMIGLTVALGVSSGLAQLESRRALLDSREAYFEAVESARRELGDLVVFVDQERPPGVGAVEHALEALYWYDAYPEQGVVVGRDVPGLRESVMARYPDRAAIRLVAGPENAHAEWEPPRLERLR